MIFLLGNLWSVVWATAVRTKVHPPSDQTSDQSLKLSLLANPGASSKPPCLCLMTHSVTGLFKKETEKNDSPISLCVCVTEEQVVHGGTWIRVYATAAGLNLCMMCTRKSGLVVKKGLSSNLTLTLRTEWSPEKQLIFLGLSLLTCETGLVTLSFDNQRRSPGTILSSTGAAVIMSEDALWESTTTFPENDPSYFWGFSHHVF